jgi:hypothetical protein
MHRSKIVWLAGSLLVAALASAPSRAAAQQVVLSERDRDLVDAYYVMEGVTMGLLGATALGGAVQLYNLPTALGDGACARGEAILGDYACQGHASLLHGALGIATIASYTATAALAFAAPDLDQDDEDTVTDVLGVVHGVGLGLTGALGLLAANPGLIGLSGNDASDFSRALRVVHWAVAMVTAGAFATHLMVDQID